MKSAGTELRIAWLAVSLVGAACIAGCGGGAKAKPSSDYYTGPMNARGSMGGGAGAAPVAQPSGVPPAPPPGPAGKRVD